MSSIQIMKKVDEFIFQNLEKIKLYEQFNDFLETYNNWDEKFQEIFKAVVLSLVLFIPSVIILIFLIINSSTHSSLETKEEILQITSKISTQKSIITQLNSKYLGTPITSQVMLETQVKSGLPAVSIDPTKVSISNFDTKDEDGLSKMSADIRFNQLSSKNLFDFLRFITIAKKMRIDEIDIKKNTQSNLLEGMITVFHYSKVSSSDNE